MAWSAKVHWSEGLFLRPHHFQQADRYLEAALEGRTRHLTPYAWGFVDLIDRSVAKLLPQPLDLVFRIPGLGLIVAVVMNGASSLIRGQRLNQEPRAGHDDQ